MLRKYMSHGSLPRERLVYFYSWPPVNKAHIASTSGSSISNMRSSSRREKATLFERRFHAATPVKSSSSRAIMNQAALWGPMERGELFNDGRSSFCHVYARPPQRLSRFFGQSRENIGLFTIFCPMIFDYLQPSKMIETFRS